MPSSLFNPSTRRDGHQTKHRLRRFLRRDAKHMSDDEGQSSGAEFSPVTTPITSMSTINEASKTEDETTLPSKSAAEPEIRETDTHIASEGKVARDLWQEALDMLPAASQQRLGIERASHKPVSDHISELLTVSKTRRDECEREAWKIRVGSHEVVLRDYAERIVTGIEQVGNIAMNFAPPQAGVAWSAVKVVLQIPIKGSEQMGALLASVDKMVSILNRGRLFETSYTLSNTSEPALECLHSALVNLYSALLEVLTNFTELFEKNTPQQLLYAILHPGKTTSLFSKLDELETNLSREVQACQSEQVSIILARVEDQARLKMLDWISSVQYGMHHSTFSEMRSANTCGWLLSHETFLEWDASSCSEVLWLQGHAGTGKTILTSKVIDHVVESIHNSPHNEGFAFFYCNKNEDSRRSPLSILQSLVRQLSTPVKRPGEIRDTLHELCIEKREKGSRLNIRDCREQLLESVKLYPTTTIILDALDESGSDEVGSRELQATRAVLVDTIRYLISNSAQRVKVFISSRPDRDIRRQLSDDRVIKVEARHNQDDIKLYVNKQISTHENWQNLPSSVRNKIVEVLCGGSQDMFLWAALQIKQLLRLETEEAIVDRLGKLPNDLKATYDEMYEAIQTRNKHDRALAERALKAVLCAHRPLKSVDILLLIRVDPDDSTPHLSSRITESQLLHLCNNLLILDSPSEVWRLSHLSVMEYLDEHHYSLEHTRIQTSITSYKLLTMSFTSSNGEVIRRPVRGRQTDSSSNGKISVISLSEAQFVFNAFGTDLSFRGLVDAAHFMLCDDNCYMEIRKLLEVLWTSRHLQTTMDPTGILSISRMLAHAEMATDGAKLATALCEDICYNLSRAQGPQHAFTIEWHRMLASLYMFTDHTKRAEPICQEYGFGLADLDLKQWDIVRPGKQVESKPGATEQALREPIKETGLSSRGDRGTQGRLYLLLCCAILLAAVGIGRYF